MAHYDFSRCSVFLVEDNVYVRNTIEDLLRHFQFERVSVAENGEAAIDYLKTMKQAGNPGPDMIISDLVMSPINGLLLLRWTRTAKDSPNRMVPFVMVSGAADREYVNSARDLGVTEFLAKPFSATSVYDNFLTQKNGSDISSVIFSHIQLKKETPYCTPNGWPTVRPGIARNG